jgi:ubiquinone/menaquinone biosynthesis C-methylase UbiE
MSDGSIHISSTYSTQRNAIHYDEFYGPLFFEPYAIEVAGRIKATPVSIVLEIAAGTGRVTRHIREAIPSSAKLIASDINGDMLGIAKKKLSQFDIDWQHIDAQQLPFDNNSIDLVVCSFGYMFVPDKPKAFAEVYRVLKRGGLFLFSTWDKLENNAASHSSVSVAKKYLKEPLPESYFMATSMSDEDEIKKLLQAASFPEISIEKVQLLSISATAKEATRGFVEGGTIYKEIKKLHPTRMNDIELEVEKELTEKFGAAPMKAPMSAVVIEARK